MEVILLPLHLLAISSATEEKMIEGAGDFEGSASF